jgi:hypothetical protein
MASPTLPCPCCDRLTLSERGGFEICPVCNWEDDGQDDLDAHVARGGPNGGDTLWEARTSFLKRRALQATAPATDEPHEKAPRFCLLDDVAVELIPASDVSPWNILHDGQVVDVTRHGARVSMTVAIRYLRSRFEVPGTSFVLELLDCSKVEYLPNEGAAISSLEEIARERPDILEAELKDDGVLVWTGDGTLRLRYSHLAIRFDSRAPLSLAALDECARKYWDEFASK